MNSETQIFYKRIKDLSRRSYEGAQYTFTGFLSMAELSDFYEQIKLPNDNQYALSPSGYKVFGGYDNADRAMIRFGNPEEFMYEQDFPIVCLLIKPLNQKFADKLSHRDFLGALMNLGIDRSKIGDILVKDDYCYIFCDENMSENIIQELTRVKHTSVYVKAVEPPQDEFEINKQEVNVQVASFRVDGVIAKIYKLSRSLAAKLFFEKKVFINGRMVQNESHQLKEGDVVAVRGFGKFEFDHISGNTRKGNMNIVLKRYV